MGYFEQQDAVATSVRRRYRCASANPPFFLATRAHDRHKLSDNAREVAVSLVQSGLTGNLMWWRGERTRLLMRLPRDEDVASLVSRTALSRRFERLRVWLSANVDVEMQQVRFGSLLRTEFNELQVAICAHKERTGSTAPFTLPSGQREESVSWVTLRFPLLATHDFGFEVTIGQDPLALERLRTEPQTGHVLSPISPL